MNNELHKLRECICSLLCKDAKPFAFLPGEVVPIESSTIRTILSQTYPDAHIRVADMSYDIVSYSELLRWLNTDSLNKMQYLKTIWDCDDFARESRCRIMRLNRMHGKNFMYAYCEGYTPMGYHAFNLSFCDGSLRIIEPQNDDTKEWHKSDYKPDFIQV